MENIEGMESSSSASTEGASDNGAIEGIVDPKAAQSVEEELVELTLGSAKTKVPKAFAETAKGFEKASREAMRKSSAIEKQYGQFMDQMKANPRAALQQLGIDPYEFSEMTLAEKLQELQKSPEQRELEQAKSRLAQYEEAERRQKEEMERLEMTKQEESVIKSLDQEITEAFSSSGLPKTPTFMRMVVAEMRGARLRGEGLTAKEACAIIEEQYGNDSRSTLKDLPPEAILKIIGEDVFKKLRQYDVNRLTGKTAPTSLPGTPQRTPSNQDAYPSRKQPQQDMNEREWRKHQESLKS